MLLAELTGVKSQGGKTAYEILNKLKKDHGIKMVSGAFGLVLTHPSWDHVVKFFVHDDCYLSFVDYCMKNKSQHLPVFKKKPVRMSVFFKQAKNTALFNKFYAVKIEKLDPISMKDHASILPMVYTGFREEYAEVIGTSREDEFLKSKKLLEHKDLANVVFDLFEKKSSGCFMDLHEGNFMKRGNTIVVIDPYGSLAGEKSLPLEFILGKAQWNDLVDYDEVADSMAGAFTVPLIRDTAPWGMNTGERELMMKKLHGD